MTVLGMDVDGVTSLAARLDGEGTTIETVTRAVDAIVAQSATEWFGPDAQQFSQQWYAQHKPALVQAHEAITVLVTALRRNIAEQQAASSNGAAPGGAANSLAHPLPLAGGLTKDGLLDVEQRSMTTGAGPTDLKGLVGLFDKAYSQPGGVAVTFVGDGANRRAIVTVSGTETWLPGSSNVDDLSTNVSDVLGMSNLKQEAIATAMRDAGVTSTDSVLLVGHSQGGADVVNFAANPALAQQFHITGVMTAGAPETVAYPANIPVLQLRTPGDVVPALGASSGAGLLAGGPVGAVLAHELHDATVPSNVDIVELGGEWRGPGGAHATSNYANDVGASTDPSVAAFAASQQQYLGGDPSTTVVYSAQRTHALYGPVGGASVPATVPPTSVPSTYQGIGGWLSDAWESVR